MKARLIITLKSSIFLIMLFSNNCFSQDEPFLVTNKLSSPESSGNIISTSNVDMFRGKVNTAIPLFNYKGREIDLPITLSYSTTGIKVDQVASYVGLGWNLDIAGRINRVVTTIPDDKISQNTNTDCVPQESYWLNESKDFYNATAPGFEDIFRYIYPIKYKSLKNPKVSIKRTDDNNLDQWKVDGEYVITDQAGNKFYYGERNANEKIYSMYWYFEHPGLPCPSVDTESSTSIMLTKIVSKNNMDEYVFNYEAFEWSEPITYPGEGYMAHARIYNQDYYRNNITSYRIKQQMLSSVYHNGDKIMDFQYGTRTDILFQTSSGNALSEIRLYNYKDDTVYKKIKFDYSYFGLANTNPHFTSRRLKLDKVRFVGIHELSETIGDTYQFEYNDPDLVPSILSSARDYLGLYNGKDNNPDLIYHPQNDSGNPHNKRIYNFNKSIIGTLKKITYPTKGFTQFEFEQNALKGGYGTDTIPQTTGVVFDKEQLSYVSAGGPNPNIVCPLGFPSSTPNSQMLQVILAQYPGNNSYTTHNSSYLLDLKTSFLRIDENTGKDVLIRTLGDGVYSIQKVYNCAPENDYDETCEKTSGPLELYRCPQNASVGCMLNAADIYHTPTSISQITDYLKGGLTIEGYNETAYSFPDYGTYQITVWAYNNVDQGNHHAEASVDIYKLNPRTIVTNPSYTVNRDQVSCHIDGFRIKSISNYTAENVFSSKKIYKYANGYRVDRVDNINTSDPGIFWEVKWYNTKGYVNPTIVHYPKVYEISINSENKNNGYVEYIYENHEASDYPCMEDPAYYNTQYDYGYPAGSVTPFSYSNLAGQPTVTSFVDNNLNLLYEKNVYDSVEKLLRKETFKYAKLEFDNGCYVGCTDWGSSYFYFNYLSYRAFTDYFPGGSITNWWDYEYYDFNLAHKVKNDFEEEEGFSFNTQLNQPPHMQKVFNSYEHALKGRIDYNYADFNGRFLLQSETKPYTSNQLPETNFTYDYDEDGNRVTITRQTPGNITSSSIECSVYGYSNRFPLATISGISYEQLINANGSLIDQIQTLSELPATSFNENALRSKLQDLRDAYPNNNVTTYTYNPVYGITSTTDEKGATVFFEYDPLGRLKFTKKQDPVTGELFIVSQNSTNTRP